MKYLRKAVISSLLAYGITSNVFAGEVDKTAQFKRYEQAKLRLTYEGEVGFITITGEPFRRGLSHIQNRL